MACFADINVSQGSVATHSMCGRIFNIHLTAHLVNVQINGYSSEIFLIG